MRHNSPREDLAFYQHIFSKAINLVFVPIIFLAKFKMFITELIIHMKKLLDSDWLRAVQFKCNSSAKSVTPVQKV